MAKSDETRSRLIPRWAQVLIGFSLVVALGVGVVHLLGRSATRQFEQFLQSLREKGQPVTFAEIEARRTVLPPEGNSALLIAALGPESASSTEGPVDANVLVFGSVKGHLHQGIPRQALEPSREYLRKRQALLQRLEPLREMPCGRIDIDLTKPTFDVSMPNLGFLRSLAKTCSLATTVSLVDGQSHEAVGFSLLQFRLSGVLDEHPTLIGRLVQISMIALALDSVEQILRVGSIAPKDIELVEAAITSRLTSDDMTWALLGERAHFLSLTELSFCAPMPTAAQAVNAQPAAFALSPAVPTWFVRKNQLKGAEMLTSLVEAARDPQELLATVQALDREIGTLGIQHSLIKILMPSLSNALKLHVKITAELRAALAALAAERFRMKTGQLPDSLEALVPNFLEELPLDPFDGKPMRFKETDEGIVIYSIDTNLLDDGGDVDWTDDKKRPADGGFRLFRPELRRVIILDEPEAPADGS